MNSESLVIKEFQAPSMHSFSTDEQRFMDEARMVMKLNHRNVVRAIDLPEQTFSREIENLHLCMEYCEGGDLRNVSFTSACMCVSVFAHIRVYVCMCEYIICVCVCVCV